MNPIYKSPLISFTNTTTQEPIIHPEGDYSQLNVKLKRLESLIEKHQPQQPLVFLYHPPAENKEIINSDKKSETAGKDQVVDMIFSLRGKPYSPSHIFIVPAIGSNPQMTKIVKVQNFNDFKTHLSQLDNLVNDATARIENEYDEHPLHYKKKVEFRSASYIDNRQAFSFWPVDKPFGEYPLSKPFFDKTIEQLSLTNDNYNIVIDFVKDWEDKYSSFDGPPKSYAIEVAVLFDNNKQLPTIRVPITEDQLKLCSNNHEFLDEKLAPVFEKISMNVPQWYESMKRTKKPKV